MDYDGEIMQGGRGVAQIDTDSSMILSRATSRTSQNMIIDDFLSENQ